MTTLTTTPQGYFGRLGRLATSRLLTRRGNHKTERDHHQAYASMAETSHILILSASVGAGHIRAAEALEKSLSIRLPTASVTHVDVLELTNAPFRSVYGKGYFKLVDHSPNLVRALYDALDQPQIGTGQHRLRLAFERFNFRRLINLLHMQPWDMVVCTHFLPAGIISTLRRSGKFMAPMQTIITDFDVHGLWVTEACDHYYVASDQTRELLIAKGVESARISVTGIPIDPIFARQHDQQKLILKHQLLEGRPTLLQMAGGFGIGSIEQIYRQIQSIERPLNIVTVTGKNTAAFTRLSALNSHPRHHQLVLGFSREVDELMSVADIVVSKPGGLTTSECLARGCPMAIVEPIPGQEERNSDFLLENRCAVRVSDLGALGARLSSLLADGDRLRELKTNARRHGRPHAASDVADALARLLV